MEHKYVCTYIRIILIRITNKIKRASNVSHLLFSSSPLIKPTSDLWRSPAPGVPRCSRPSPRRGCPRQAPRPRAGHQPLQHLHPPLHLRLLFFTSRRDGQLVCSSSFAVSTGHHDRIVVVLGVASADSASALSSLSVEASAQGLAPLSAPRGWGEGEAHLGSYLYPPAPLDKAGIGSCSRR